MEYNRETIKWLHTIKELTRSVRFQVKTPEEFLKIIKTKIETENIRISSLITQKNKLRESRRGIEATEVNIKKIRDIKDEEMMYSKFISERKYPEELNITNEKTFLKIYYYVD